MRYGGIPNFTYKNLISLRLAWLNKFDNNIPRKTSYLDISNTLKLHKQLSENK